MGGEAGKEEGKDVAEERGKLRRTSLSGYVHAIFRDIDFGFFFPLAFDMVQ